MKTCLILLALLAGGCAATPDWWPHAPGHYPEALDFYLWQRFYYERWDCATWGLTRRYPPETVGPVVSAALAKTYGPERMDVLRGVRLYCIDDSRFPMDKDIRTMLAKTAERGGTAEEREYAAECLQEWQKRKDAEHGAPSNPHSPSVQ